MINFFFSLACFIAAVVTFSYAQSQGGAGAQVVIRDHVLTGSMVYGVAGLLVVAGFMFGLSAIMKTVRRMAVLIAVVLVVASAGLGLFSPQDVGSYLKDHGCPDDPTNELAKRCDDVIKNSVGTN